MTLMCEYIIFQSSRSSLGVVDTDQDTVTVT